MQGEAADKAFKVEDARVHSWIEQHSWRGKALSMLYVMSQGMKSQGGGRG